MKFTKHLLLLLATLFFSVSGFSKNYVWGRTEVGIVQLYGDFDTSFASVVKQSANTALKHKDKLDELTTELLKGYELLKTTQKSVYDKIVLNLASGYKSLDNKVNTVLSKTKSSYEVFKSRIKDLQVRLQGAGKLNL